jgi:hypothetical protein
MEKLVFDTDAVAVVVRRLAAENPEFIYDNGCGDGTKCSYATGGPNDRGCIIGQAVREVSIALYEWLYAKEKCVTNGFPVWSLEFHKTEIETIGSHSIWLNRVQTHQDKKVSWSESVRVADESSRQDAERC